MENIKIRTFSIDTGDGEHIFTEMKSLIDHLNAEIDDFSRKAKDFPEAFGSEELTIELKAEFKYTQEEVDNFQER